MAVQFIDLDGFKLINDLFGHEIGDVLLCKVVDKLTSRLRESDPIARLRGDEFIILLEGIPQPEDAGIVVGKVLEDLFKPFHINEDEILISACVGISIFPQDGDEVDDLIRNADSAIYGVKEAGKNNYSFYVPGVINSAGLAKRDTSYSYFPAISELTDLT